MCFCDSFIYLFIYPGNNFKFPENKRGKQGSTSFRFCNDTTPIKSLFCQKNSFLECDFFHIFSNSIEFCHLKMLHPLKD